MPPWTKSDDGTYYALAEIPSGSQYSFTVEKMDGAGDAWEWFVWLAGHPECWSRHGFGRSPLEAMTQAEHAFYNGALRRPNAKGTKHRPRRSAFGDQKVRARSCSLSTICSTRRRRSRLDS